MEKGQVAFEYLVITGFFLVVAGVLFIYAIVTVNSSLANQQANDAVSAMASNADFVASMGNGSNIAFDVKLPENSGTIYMRDKYIRLVMGSGSGESSYYAYTKVNLVPSTLSVSGGRKYFKAIFLDGNVMVVEA